MQTSTRCFEIWHEEHMPSTPYVQMMSAWEEATRQEKKRGDRRLRAVYRFAHMMLPKSKKRLLYEKLKETME